MSLTSDRNDRRQELAPLLAKMHSFPGDEELRSRWSPDSSEEEGGGGEEEGEEGDDDEYDFCDAIAELWAGFKNVLTRLGS